MTASPTGTATLVAKGAAVNVDVTYSYSPGTTSASVFLQLTQRVSGGRVATGSGFVSGLVCDGTEHTTTVTVIADGDVAFKKGDAVVREAALPVTSSAASRACSPRPPYGSAEHRCSLRTSTRPYHGA